MMRFFFFFLKKNDEIFYLIHGGYFVKIIWAVF
jgi:hypothetical protein